jgi:hypothetical protein
VVLVGLPLAFLIRRFELAVQAERCTKTSGDQKNVIAILESRDYIMVEDVVQLPSLGSIPGGIVAMLLAVAEGPADVRVVCLGPPSIEFREG